MTSNRPYLLRAYFDWIVDNNLTPQILVDATLQGVEVPTACCKNGKVVLNISPGAVEGFILEHEWVSFKARFTGRSHDISLPVAAILALFARENSQGIAFEPAPASGGGPSQAVGSDSTGSTDAAGGGMYQNSELQDAVQPPAKPAKKQPETRKPTLRLIK